ncbi:MAG TPA: AAA family ATPase, partial [Acetobacteraceae bacterium]|nr:AAA family ATPase [Acetobacteraceae bacterium]
MPAAIDLKMLISRMSSMNRRGLEAAAGQALNRTHYHVEPEHWLYQVIDMPGTDVSLLVDAFDVDRAAAAAELTAALELLRSGNGRAPSLAPFFVELLKSAWLFASAEQGQAVLRSGHLLWAMLSTEDGAGRLTAAAPGLARLLPDVLRRDFDQLLAGSAETPPAGPVRASLSPAAPTNGSALERFTVDLTARARAGRIDPILGRDAEIRQVIDILTRRRQNNPIMTGDAGVGKTAVVEGLALRIAAADVPPPLAPVSIRTLDLGLLQAGAGMKGEFENRLRSVIDEAQASPAPVILFVDEAHTLIGAGGAAGQGDAANLLKPPLARGELRVIAATTWAEYKKYFEKDAALARRFQPVKVEEPSEPVAIDMVRGLVPSLESHHEVRILDEAVVAAVRLSMRYLQGRQLPDKAVSLMDTACARVAMSQAATPPAVEDRRRRMAAIAAELRLLHREEVCGADHGERMAA